jgi:hypothetical protein
VELARLLAERFPAWSASGRRPFSDAFRLAASRPGRSFLAILCDLLAEGASITELQNDAVYDLCLQGEDVRLGLEALSEVLPAPDDAVSSLDVLPGTDEEVFLLLRPQQLDAILHALQARTPEPALRPPATMEALCRLREACTASPGQLVAWCFEA